MKNLIDVKEVKKIFLRKFYFLIIYLGFKSDRSQHLSQISATDRNFEEYWFVCRQWFDKDRGDRQTIRELLPTDAEGNILNGEHGKMKIFLL